MFTETEKRIALLAVENNLLTKSQVAQALWLREKQAPDRPLEEVLVEQGLLTPEQMREVVRIVSGVQAPSHRADDRRFAEILVDRGYATRGQVDEALSVRYFLAERGIHRYLGDILVERAGVAVARIVEVLQAQGKIIVACEACREQYNSPAGETFACPECGRPLREVIDTDSVAVKGTLVRKRDPRAATGVRIGPCDLKDIISRGPLSALYRAHHTGLNREVAVKLIPLQGLNAPLAKRFFENARRMQEIVDPGFARVLESGTRGTTFYVVRQFVEGVSLRELVANGGRLPQAEAVALLRNVARAAGVVHRAGAVHGNLQGGNVIVTDKMEAVLADAGLGRDHPAALAGDLDPLGAAIHTMAPEQWQGRAADARTDLYALGALFHLMLTGEYPFAGLAPREVRDRHLRVAAPPARKIVADVPLALCAIERKLLLKDPEKRYASVEELLADLDDFEQRRPVQALEQLMQVKCPFCETLNPSSAEKCSVCREPLCRRETLDIVPREDEVICRNCRSPLPARSRACSTCGTAFSFSRNRL